MALTESVPTPLGTPCPPFTLPAVNGMSLRLEDIRTPGLLVVFMCNHCPYVQAVDDRLNALAQAFRGHCTVVGISSNDAQAYPEDSFAAMGARALEKGYVFPYLYDESQDVARAFGAVCTPDYFLYGPDRRLAYRGRLDDSWKDPAQVTREDLREAIDALLAGREAPQPQHPSLGCSLKWKRA